VAWTNLIAVRFPDVDWARVVYFARFFDYSHRTFEDFFGAEVGLPYSELLQHRKLGFPIVHTEADFRSPLRFGDTARMVLEVLRVTDRSVTTRYSIYRGDSEALCARLILVQAAVDCDGFKPAVIPRDIKEVFERHLVTEATP
jgi:YbgC/YbaW family acyl-CoA thioester hydrolase